MGEVHRYLLEHPGFIPLLGFPLVPAPNHPLGFNAPASLPTPRHLTHLLRQLPNAALQWLLTDSVRLIVSEVTRLTALPIECVSLDTKHILAWVKENNPKTYVADRFNKTKQPVGDRDCKLGCKRRRNQAAPPTPTHSPVAARLKIGEYYWGYASGIVVTHVLGWGEFVLAEWTQPFDQSDVTYFFPLMRQVEERLGDKPRYGTFDAAFDAWYVYAYFYRENNPQSGYAAVPFRRKVAIKPMGDSSRLMVYPSVRPVCRCPSSSPLSTAPRVWWNMSVASTSARCSSHSRPVKSVRSVTRIGRTAAAPR